MNKAKKEEGTLGGARKSKGFSAEPKMARIFVPNLGFPRNVNTDGGRKGRA